MSIENSPLIRREFIKFAALAALLTNPPDVNGKGKKRFVPLEKLSREASEYEGVHIRTNGYCIYAGTESGPFPRNRNPIDFLNFLRRDYITLRLRDEYFLKPSPNGSPAIIMVKQNQRALPDVSLKSMTFDSEIFVEGKIVRGEGHYYLHATSYSIK